MKCPCADHPGVETSLKSTPRALLKLMSKHLQISPLKKLPRPLGRGPINKVAQAASLCLSPHSQQASCLFYSESTLPNVAQAASLSSTTQSSTGCQPVSFLLAYLETLFRATDCRTSIQASSSTHQKQ